MKHSPRKSSRAIANCNLIRSGLTSTVARLRWAIRSEAPACESRRRCSTKWKSVRRNADWQRFASAAAWESPYWWNVFESQKPDRQEGQVVSYEFLVIMCALAYARASDTANPRMRTGHRIEENTFVEG